MNKEKNKQITDFICNTCDKDKYEKVNLARVNGLGINPQKLQQICADCLKWVDVINDQQKTYEF